MSQDWSAPGWAVAATVLALLALGVAVVLLARRQRDRSDAAVTATRIEVQLLQTQVEAMERRLMTLRAPAVERESPEYKITMLGEEPTLLETQPQATVVPAPVFADLVLRESAVHVVSFAAGLRRALAPETRNRVRFAMRGELKRARKQRRLDLRRARQLLREGSAV